MTRSGVLVQAERSEGEEIDVQHRMTGVTQATGQSALQRRCGLADEVERIASAHQINRGAIPDLSKPEGDSDFYFVQANDPETAVARIIELVKTRLPQRFGLDPIRDIQVLCPMSRGGCGARSLNIELQAVLNLGKG